MHFGKGYPNQIKNWRRFPMLVAGGPTRKMQLVQVGALHTGTVAELWAGTTTISDVADYWPDDEHWTVFTFTNATDSLATIEVRAILEEILPHPGFGEVYGWRIVYEAYYDGNFLARRSVRTPLDTSWGNPHSDSQVGPSWLDVTSPSMWNQISFRVGAATWDQQPDFQPYHTRP